MTPANDRPPQEGGASFWEPVSLVTDALHRSPIDPCAFFAARVLRPLNRTRLTQELGRSCEGDSHRRHSRTASSALDGFYLSLPFVD